MKRLYSLVFALCAIIFSFCTKDESFLGDMPSGDEPAAPQSEIRSVDEALGELSDLLDVIDDKQTRSGKYRTIRSVSVSGGAATRGSDNPLPDTLVYVVNFDNEEGFAILGAHRALPPVYAITESGTFDASELDIAIASSQAEQAKIAAMSEEERAALFAEPTEEDEEEPIENIGPAFVTSLIADNIVGQPITPTFPKDSLSFGGQPIVRDSSLIGLIPEPVLISTEVIYTSDWTTLEKKGPYVNTKWAQDDPFNRKCPMVVIAGNNNNFRALVGCVPVAVGQILTANAHPDAIAHFKFDFSKSDYYYGTLKTAYTYYGGDTDDATANYVAGFLHDLGHWYYCRVDYDKDGTFGNIERACRTFEKMGYSKAAIYLFNPTRIKDMFSSYKPVYIRGISTLGEKVGHAWVIDGLCERVRTIRYKHTYEHSGSLIRYTYKYTQETETQNLLHCNMGWRGGYDGYYLEGVFDTRAIQCIDEVKDKSTTSTDHSYFSKDLQIITY